MVTEANNVVSGKYSVGGFPKQFERHWSDSFDKRFAAILIGSFIIHFSIALYFAFNPPPDKISEKDIQRIQQQFASLVLKQEIVEEEIVESDNIEDQLSSETIAEKDTKENKNKSEEKTGEVEKKESTKETKVASAETRKQQRSAGARSRRQSREQISKEVSSKGLLGLLTGTGSAASGEGAVDLLGDVDKTSGDLDNAFNQIDGLKRASSSGETSGKGTRSAKGTRVTSGGNIDDLISDRGEARSTDVERSGDLMVGDVSAIENEDGVKNESRNSDDVTAVVTNHNSAITYCYERELKRNPDLKGKIVVRFVVAPNGKVKDVKIVSSTLNNQSVERCIISRIRRWDDFGAIDASKGDATFRQVYTFGY